MILKQLGAVFGFGGRLNELKKFNLATKRFLYTHRHLIFNQLKTFQSCSNIDKFYIQSVIVRYSHISAVTHHSNVTENGFARNFLECSEAYSNSVRSSLSLDKDLQIENIENILQKQWISMDVSEILQNFEHISIYASKNDISINNAEYSGILEVISYKLQDFSDKDIHFLLSCLELWKHEPTKNTYKNLLTILDKQCLIRMSKWNLEEILLTNDQIFKLRMARYLEFTWQSLKKLGRKCRQMTPANLVQFAFLIKVNRKLPINLYEIEYRFEKYFDNYSLEELAIIAMAFNKYEGRIRSTDLLYKIVQRLCSEIDNVNDIALKNIIEIISCKIPISNEPIRSELNMLLKTLEKHVSNFGIKTLVNIMLLQSTIVMYNEQLTLKILDRFEKDIKNMSLKDLEKVIFALHKLNDDFKSTRFYSAIYNNLKDPNRAEDIDKSSYHFMRIVNYMLKEQFYPEGMLQRILEPEFIKKIKGPSLYRLDRSYLEIDFCIELEHPEYNGPRLPKDILSFLMKHHGSMKKVTETNSKMTHLERTQINVVNIMKKIIKDETVTVSIDKVLPHDFQSFIIIGCDSKTNEFLSMSKRLDSIPLGTIKYAPDDKNKWYAILVTKKFFIHDDSYKITGNLAQNLRQLKSIGYSPIAISLQEWQDLVTDDEKINYLKNRLI